MLMCIFKLTFNFWNLTFSDRPKLLGENNVEFLNVNAVVFKYCRFE